MAAMVEVARCGVGPDDALPRMDAPDEFSADEIRGALASTRAAASNQLSLAWDLINRLPQVFAALETGGLDVPKTRVFAEWTCGLTDDTAPTATTRRTGPTAGLPGKANAGLGLRSEPRLHTRTPEGQRAAGSRPPLGSGGFAVEGGADGVVPGGGVGHI
jgi:hypothetical protein